jgi:hypothetical protein
VSHRSASWWTDADQAELELLVGELMCVVRAHQARCLECSTVGIAQAECPPLRRSFEAVLDWRESRIRQSKAAWLRWRENERALVQAREVARVG